MVRIILLLIVVVIQVPYMTAGMTFCSGTSTTNDLRTRPLVAIDGSLRGVNPHVDTLQDPYSCTCIVEPISTILTGKVSFSLDVGTVMRDCGRRVDINGYMYMKKDAFHTFTCPQESTTINGSVFGGKIVVTLVVGSNTLPDVGQYQLAIELDTSMSVRTSCHVPVVNTPPTSTSTSVLSSSSVESSSIPSVTTTPPTNTTVRVSGLAEKHATNTIVIAVVVVGLGLLAVVFIIIMILCRGRREERKARALSTAQEPATVYQRIYRRASRMYDYLKNARPLPPLPAGRRSIHKYDLGPMESGHYSSIKFSHTNTKVAQGKLPVAGSSSVSSTSDYIHPINMDLRQDNTSPSNGHLASNSQNSKPGSGIDKHVITNSISNKSDDNSGNINNHAILSEKNVAKQTPNDSTYIQMNQSAVKYNVSPTESIGLKHDTTLQAPNGETENVYMPMNQSKEDEYVSPTVANTEVEHACDAQIPTDLPVHTYENRSFSGCSSTPTHDIDSRDTTADKEDYINMEDFIPKKVDNKNKVQNTGSPTYVANDGNDGGKQPDNETGRINGHETVDSTTGVKHPVIAQDSLGYATMNEIVDPSISTTIDYDSSTSNSSESPSSTSTPDTTFSDLFVFKQLSNDTTIAQNNQHNVFASTCESEKSTDNTVVKIKPTTKRYIKQAPTDIQN